MTNESNLRHAAQAVIDRWDTPLWKDVPATATYINALREALMSQPEQAADDKAGGESNFYPSGIAHLIPPITMAVGQLRYAVLGMGGDDNGTLLTFQHRLACKDMDGEDAPAGMVCWLHEYPDEGSLHLPNDIAPPWSRPEQVVVPLGWKLVPIEPTEKMLASAASHDWDSDTDPTWKNLYCIMLSAAPQPPQSSEWKPPNAPELYKFINETPALQSLLYDINLLPEQINDPVRWGYLLSVCSRYERPQSPALDKLTALSEDAKGYDEDFAPHRGNCKKCGTQMQPGQAIEQTMSAGMPDFPGDYGITMSPGGPGKLVDCLKCPSCGWSTTA